MHYPSETACVMLFARIIATVRQASALFMQFCHRANNEEEEIAHIVIGKEFKDQLETTNSYEEECLGS